MEPSEVYNRSKRNLAIFAGLLVLVVFGGAEQDASQHIAVLPIKVSQNVLQHVIAAVTLYCLYQYLLSWSFQADDLRKKIRVDFWVLSSVSAFALFSYIVSNKNLIAELLAGDTSRKFISFISFVVTLGAGVAALFFLSELRARNRQVFQLRRETIENRLFQDGWGLLFNPSQGMPSGSKRISFLEDGSIGEGKNKNEHLWQIKDGELIIFRADGSLQNIFRYDSRTDQFLCTNDANAKGRKDQVIFRISNTGDVS